MVDAGIKKPEQEENKEFEINALYKNGERISIRTTLTGKDLDYQLNVIALCYKADKPGFLLINGTFIKISETCQIQIKAVPPTSEQK